MARRGLAWQGEARQVLDDILCFVGLIAVNAAIALILYGFAPEIAAWAVR